MIPPIMIKQEDPWKHQFLKWMTQAQYLWFRPQFEGVHNLPDHHRVLFVGNHTIFGLLDAPLLARELALEYGIPLRSLGDRFHFRVPVWRDALRSFGVVEGTPENCHRLMEAGEPILVFPGGGREVCKRRGEAYQLIWKKRSGFARLAASHDYSIVPFAALGAEECYRIHWDANDMLRYLPDSLRDSNLIQKTLRNGEALPPIATGVGFTPIPRTARFRFVIGEPIETKTVDPEQPQEVWALREQVRETVQKLLDTS